jgi:hypothetical protein
MPETPFETPKRAKRRRAPDEPLKYEKSSLAELLTATYPPSDWILENFIHTGDQVILAGPPKIGKSILGTQLAWTVAKGEGHFVSKEFKPAGRQRPVLVFSLEMNAPMVAERLRQVFPRTADGGLENQVPDFPLTFVFSAKDRTSFDVIDFDSFAESKAKKAGTARLSEDGEYLQDVIRREKPDLIVFDTLIRVHGLDENNNVAMSYLLRMLREICSIDERIPVEPEGPSTETRQHQRKIAHVVIHHTRKESATAHGAASRDANSVRGAGAIHAEADLVLTMSEAYGKDTIMISTSARRVSLPDEIYAKRSKFKFEEIPRPLGVRQTKAKKLAEALWGALKERSAADLALTRADLVQRVAELGYGDLTEDNFRKTYYRKIAPFVIVNKPKRGETDQNHRYRLRESADEKLFRVALKAGPEKKERATD